MVFSILEYSEITKITLDFKTHVFVFRGIGVFWTLVFCKFRVGQGCFDIYKKNKKVVGT